MAAILSRFQYFNDFVWRIKPHKNVNIWRKYDSEINVCMLSLDCVC